MSKLLSSESYPDENRISLFYGQCYVVTEYLLRRKGLPTFIQFLKALTANQMSLDEALQKFYRIRSTLTLHNLAMATA